MDTISKPVSDSSRDCADGSAAPLDCFMNNCIEEVSGEKGHAAINLICSRIWKNFDINFPSPILLAEHLKRTCPMHYHQVALNGETDLQPRNKWLLTTADASLHQIIRRC